MLISNSTAALDQFLKAIQVPQSKYEAANTSFKSICDWFQRDESTIRSELLESFLQGSFRLGTAIRPTTDEDDYDLDIVVNPTPNPSGVSPPVSLCVPQAHPRPRYPRVFSALPLR